MSSSHVKTLNKNNWSDALDKADKENKLMVLEFMAPWSEPCKLMNPVIANTFAPEFAREAQFYMLDTDEFKDLARNLRVEALPTFVLVKNYEVKKRVVGVDKDELRRNINMYK